MFNVYVWAECSREYEKKDKYQELFVQLAELQVPDSIVERNQVLLHLFLLWLTSHC